MTCSAAWRSSPTASAPARIAGAGGPFTDVVNIGIGGSDLGPAMATRALAPYHDGPRLHFVSNVDGADIRDTLAGLDPARTLFLVASKTFTTIETMTNAATARRWIVDALGEEAVGAHFAAISTALDKVAAFGIGAGPHLRLLGLGRRPLFDLVGDRPAADDRHRPGALPRVPRRRPGDGRSFPHGAARPEPAGHPGADRRLVPQRLGFPIYAVLPYDQRLERLPAYLQQLDMESNGKRVRLGGATVMGATGPIVFGEPGTNGQHAFYQLLHQGTDVIPCDFLVGAALRRRRGSGHQELLLANCLAQSEALMRGQTLAEAKAEMKAQGLSPRDVERLAPHKVFPGNRPSNTILYRRLDPGDARHDHRALRAQDLRPGRRSGGSIPSTSGASNSARRWPGSSCRWSRAGAADRDAIPRPSG